MPGTSAVNLQTAPEGAALRKQYRHAFAYWDVWVDDARLVILNAKDAARRGAEILTRTACTTARRGGQAVYGTRRFPQPDGFREITARAIFNAAGPWVEQVLGNTVGINTSKRIRLVKGSHIILRRWWQGTHGYVLQAPDKRLIFVNPYFENMALVGTTDIAFDGRPDDVAIDSDETDYLIEILNSYFQTSLARRKTCCIPIPGSGRFLTTTTPSPPPRSRGTMNSNWMATSETPLSYRPLAAS